MVHISLTQIQFCESVPHPTPVICLQMLQRQLPSLIVWWLLC